MLLGFLAACAAPAPEAPPPETPKVDFTALGRELAALPGAVGSEKAGEPGIGYPDGVLFAEGAVLPLPGGTAMLDPLAELLRSHPEVRWRLTVRARTAFGEAYDRRLAVRRAELLKRFFRNRGVASQRLELQVEATAGPALELAPGRSDQPAKDASSAAEKP